MKNVEAVAAGCAILHALRKAVDGTHAVRLPVANPVQEHIRLLGILWMALSAVNVLGGGALLIVANTFFARWNRFQPRCTRTFFSLC